MQLFSPRGIAVSVSDERAEVLLKQGYKASTDKKTPATATTTVRRGSRAKASGSDETANEPKASD